MKAGVIMRELVFKNLISKDKKRRDLYISEVDERNGVKTVTKRHSVYIIRESRKITDQNELIKWQKEKSVNCKKRHVFIFKKKDTKSKKDSFICDVVGKFYAVVKDELYSIAFKHSFELDFLFAKDSHN